MPGDCSQAAASAGKSDLWVFFPIPRSPCRHPAASFYSLGYHKHRDSKQAFSSTQIPTPE